ncbi:hypothetical protein FRC11_007712 [Ceratobasidium sp. 423]|nr:hypothetical protein FRC11_007712 [Ceratobasidium sp. 423]
MSPNNPPPKSDKKRCKYEPEFGTTGEQARNKRNIKSAERNRITSKVKWLTEARKGMPLEGPEYDFLFSRKYMSPEASDAENDKWAVVDDPSHRSDLVRNIYGTLAEKYKSGHKRTSTTQKDTHVYIKVDAPLPELINSTCIQHWAINDNYFKTHQDEINKKRSSIDLKAVNAPDLREFFE